MGALGGNVAGGILKKFNLGTLWNSVVGIIGGAGGGQLLGSLGALTGNGLLDQGLGGIAGGGILMTIIGLVKSVISKN